MRVKAVIAYDGSSFEGFQRQKRTENTVTGHIERALLSLGIDSPIVGSGRTDSGVHASGQVIHFDLPPHWHRRSLDELRRHIDSRLESIDFKHISRVDSTFHARYDAKVRIYRYVFRSSVSVFERRYVARMSLDTHEREKMRKALLLFTGRHDFEYFMKKGSDTRNYVRNVYAAYTKYRGEYGFVYLHANGYLRSQVRLMVAAAYAVAKGRLQPDELAAQIDRRARYISAPAPAEGLYLARVIY
jgi:tRNA pseudouridine38-40 synthase